MPTPINHRDITLTQTGRDGSTKFQHCVRVHLDATTVVGVIGLPFTELTTAGNNSKHELRIIDLGTPKVKIFWDIECSYTPPTSSPLDTPSDSASQYRNPASATAASQTRPSTAAEFFKDLDGGWSFSVFMWKGTVPNNWTVTESVVSGSEGMTWSITVKKNDTVRFDGALSISAEAGACAVQAMRQGTQLATRITTALRKSTDRRPTRRGANRGKKVTKTTAAKGTKKR